MVVIYQSPRVSNFISQGTRISEYSKTLVSWSYHIMCRDLHWNPRSDSEGRELRRLLQHLPLGITVVTSRHAMFTAPTEHRVIKFGQKYVVADHDDMRDTFRKNIRRIDD